MPYQVLNVFDYLNATQIADVEARTGAQDVTTALQNAINALAPYGMLCFPPGRYCTTGGLTVPTNCRIVGSGCGNMGSGSGSATDGVTQIECSSATANLFTFTCLRGSIENMFLKNTAATPTAGAAVRAVNANAAQRIDYTNLHVGSFYDGIDVETGEGWVMHGCTIIRSTRYGLRVRNTVSADTGDWCVSNSYFADLAGASNISVESSGGGKIIGNKFFGSTTTATHAIVVNVSGGTSQLLILGNSIENMSQEPILITSGLPFIVIDANYILANNGYSAINATSASKMVIAGNTLDTSSNSGAAISLTSCTGVTIGDNMVSDFATYLSASGCTGILTNSMPAQTVANLPSAGQMADGARASVTDASATTFMSNVAGGGANHVPVFCDSTNWKIG